MVKAIRPLKGTADEDHAANLRRATTTASIGARSAAFPLPRASDAACAAPRVGPLGDAGASDPDRRHLRDGQQPARPERLRRRNRLAERRLQGLRRGGHGLAGELLARRRAVDRRAPRREGPSPARFAHAATDPHPHDPPARLEPSPRGPADPGHRSSHELDASSQLARDLTATATASSPTSTASTSTSASSTSASSTPASSATSRLRPRRSRSATRRTAPPSPRAPSSGSRSR